MNRIGGIDVDRVYTADEIGEMILNDSIRAVVLKGYVAQANADGTCRFVPYFKSGLARQPDLAVGAVRALRKPRKFEAQEDVAAKLAEDLPTIRKRTPQERLDSLASRIAPDAAALGIKPGEGEAVKARAAEELFGTEKENEVKAADTRLRANRKERRRQENLERLERKGLI